MATDNKKSLFKSESDANRLRNLKEIEKQKLSAIETFRVLGPTDQLDLLERLGCGKDFFTCQCCSEIKKKSDFYMSTEPNCKSGVTKICKQCAKDIAMPVIDGVEQQPTKKSVDDAMYALNKPMLETVWEASLLEAANTVTGKPKSNVYAAYCKNVQMHNWYTLTYRDSDNYTGGAYSLDDMVANVETSKDQEIIEQFEKNKNDTLRLLGYLPFDKEKLSDQPFLYAQLIGFLDASEEGNDDMMRTASIIDIVRSFNQQSNINDMISSLTKDPRSAEKNVATVKALQEMKKNITLNITKLAEQSCISLKNNRKASKSSTTWTGKLKQIKEMNLREGEVNGFDVETCKGMMQVMEMSDASIMKQLALDESEWSDMVAEQRVMIRDLQKDKSNYMEISRILLRENIDLRDYLDEHGLLNKDNLVDLDDLYSVFSGINGGDESDH